MPHIIRSIALALGIAVFPAAAWQAELPRDLVLLRNVKARMKQNLARVPNYTCLETMARTRRAPPSMIIAVPGKSVPFRRADIVRFEVAEVNGDELFALPGNHDFRKMSLHELGAGGLIGNGLFSLLAHDVFTSNVASYNFIGEEKLDGKLLLRFDFKVSELVSGYNIQTSWGNATVGYHGSFWADPQTFDAVRLNIVADEIPAYLRVDRSGDRIDYAWVRIGASDALLPQSGELSMRQYGGWESLNELSFTHCREYGVETTISFGEVNDAAGKSEGTRDVELPGGLQLTISLETPIDSDKAATGDPITGRVDADAKHKGKIVVHKDALVSGRLRRIEQHLEGWPYVLAKLEFTQIEFEGKTARFFAQFEKIIPQPGSEGIKRVATKDLPGFGGLPGIGTLSVTGNRMVLPAGTRMIWKTSSYDLPVE